jgi:hypothetical protein
VLATWHAHIRRAGGQGKVAQVVLHFVMVLLRVCAVCCWLLLSCCCPCLLFLCVRDV